MLADSVISPPQMRDGAAIRPPCLGDTDEVFRRWPGFEFEPESNGFLDGQIARRPRVPVTNTEKKVDVGGPGSNSMERSQLTVCTLEVFHFELG